jgi:hypothetical protein
MKMDGIILWSKFWKIISQILNGESIEQVLDKENAAEQNLSK